MRSSESMSEPFPVGEKQGRRPSAASGRLAIAQRGQRTLWVLGALAAVDVALAREQSLVDGVA
jgi:hypothetical protein